MREDPDFNDEILAELKENIQDELEDELREDDFMESIKDDLLSDEKFLNRMSVQFSDYSHRGYLRDNWVREQAEEDMMDQDDLRDKGSDALKEDPAFMGGLKQELRDDEAFLEELKEELRDDLEFTDELKEDLKEDEGLVDEIRQELEEELTEELKKDPKLLKAVLSVLNKAQK